MSVTVWQAHLEALAHRKCGKTTDVYAELCQDADVEREVLKELTEHARKSKQVKFAANNRSLAIKSKGEFRCIC